MAFTRDFAGVRPVPALDQINYDGSCGGSPVTFTGKIVDRLALGVQYQAVQPVAFAEMDLGTSTAVGKYGAVTAILQHSNTTSTSATGALGWAVLTCALQSCEQPLFNITGPSSSAGGYLSSGVTATSTGQASGASATSVYDLGAAQQYIRLQIIARNEASSSGGAVLQLKGALLFGEPQTSIPSTTSTGSVLKSTS